VLLFALVTAASPAQGQVSGVVVDMSTLLPVPDALVSVQTPFLSTKTGPDGHFDLPGATGSSLVIVGAKKGFFNYYTIVSAPATEVEVELDPVPPDDDPGYDFAAPSDCAACHDVQRSQWTGSPMSRAGENAWVYDLYDGTGTAGGLGGFVYVRDSQHAATNPESECASCHQPESWIASPFTSLEDFGNLSEAALHGISCEVCHKTADIDISKKNFPGIYPGVVTITRPAPGTGQVQYGVLGDTNFILPQSMQPSYQPQLVADACAACHQDKNDPDQDGDFEESNGVVSENTYEEWAASPYADPGSPLYATCVDCHMPSYGGTQVCNLGGPVRDPERLGNHRIDGTTAEFLEDSVTLSMIVAEAGSALDVEVSIANDRTGHHVPTGTTIRNMILLVEALREEDGVPLVPIGTQVIHDLGGIGHPVQGYYAGLPGKLYGKVTHDGGGQWATLFTEATGVLFDTRIPALATDITDYRFEIPPGGGTLHVRARLIYRRAYRPLADAKGWVNDGLGNPLEDLAAPHFGHLMEEVEWSMAVTGAGPVAQVRRSATLYPSYPNPARSSAAIRFHLAEGTPARVAIFDVRGRVVTTLTEGFRGAGEHTVEWRGLDAGALPVSAGVYFYRLQTDSSGPLWGRMIWLK
jgi:hypothetical protein